MHRPIGVEMLVENVRVANERASGQAKFQLGQQGQTEIGDHIVQNQHGPLILSIAGHQEQSKFVESKEDGHAEDEHHSRPFLVVAVSSHAKLQLLHEIGETLEGREDVQELTDEIQCPLGVLERRHGEGIDQKWT